MMDPKILDKIKKCLALSASSNEHEATAAMRQARKLMDAHGLDEADVIASAAHEETVPTGTTAKPPAWMWRLAGVCASAFGSEVICSGFHLRGIAGEWAWRFIGCGVAPQLAAYAYDVLRRQLDRSRRAFVATQTRCKLATKRARGDAFANGWIAAVRAKVQDFAGADAAAASAIEAYMAKRYPDLKTSTTPRRQVARRNECATTAGWQAGRDAQLHHGVTAPEQPALTVER